MVRIPFQIWYVKWIVWYAIAENDSYYWDNRRENKGSLKNRNNYQFIRKLIRKNCRLICSIHPFQPFSEKLRRIQFAQFAQLLRPRSRITARIALASDKEIYRVKFQRMGMTRFVSMRIFRRIHRRDKSPQGHVLSTARIYNENLPFEHVPLSAWKTSLVKRLLA